MKRRIVSMVLCIVMVFTMAPNVFASTGTHTAGSGLTIPEKVIYEKLVTEIRAIAAGEKDNACILFGTEPAEVDVGGAKFSLAPVDAVPQELTIENIGDVLKNVGNALLADYPYEMFWYDKTDGHRCGYTYVNNNTITQLHIVFSVIDDYQGNAGAFSLNTEKTKGQAPQTAFANASQVITDNANESDFEKLKAYKDYICEAVSYDHAAAMENPSEYDDSYQMISVFDGDDTTNVVCEGYSKAFQYLCDNTTWNDSTIQCYTVTGTMSDETGVGNHMWNVVTIDGNNYLVDVTNSDNGTVGQDGGLFLVGGTPAQNGSYTFAVGGQNVTFTYATDPQNGHIWGEGVTELATTDYAPVPSPEETTYTVTFDTRGHGTAPVAQTITSGENAAVPTAPTVVGYIFGGWYTDENCTSEYDFNTAVTSNITLYAKWTTCDHSENTAKTEYIYDDVCYIIYECVNCTDYYVLLLGDLTRDGALDEGDMDAFVSQYLYDKERVRLIGDVNNDKKVNSTDAVLVLRHAARYDVGEFNVNVADFTRDGTTNSTDAVAILRYAARYNEVYWARTAVTLP